jgi:hypothetical protein
VHCRSSGQEAALQCVNAIVDERFAIVRAHEAAGFMYDQVCGREVPVMLCVESESRVCLSTRHQGKSVRYRIPLNDLHLRPWLAPSRVLEHRPESGHAAAFYYMSIANVD